MRGRCATSHAFKPSDRHQVALTYWHFFCFCSENGVFSFLFSYRNPQKVLAEDGFDPSTCGLWAHHASTAPLCLEQRKLLLTVKHKGILHKFVIWCLVDRGIKEKLRLMREGRGSRAFPPSLLRICIFFLSMFLPLKLFAEMASATSIIYV